MIKVRLLRRSSVIWVSDEKALAEAKKKPEFWDALCDCLNIFVAEQHFKAHCKDVSGKFRGCHETFSDPDLLREHKHPLTGGCRYPGNLEDFYRLENVWHKKEPKSDEDTPDQSPNSKRSRGAGKRTTSKDSREQKFPDAQLRGQF